MLLKPNMVVAGHDFPRPVLAVEVAAATLRVLRRTVPVAVPGIVFLSGGQGDQEATRNLQAMNASPQRGPWPLSFSFGRALQDAPIRAWRGHPTGVEAGQEALFHRARCNSAAAAGAYDPRMEEQGPSTSPMVH